MTCTNLADLSSIKLYMTVQYYAKVKVQGHGGMKMKYDGKSTKKRAKPKNYDFPTRAGCMAPVTN